MDIEGGSNRALHTGSVLDYEQPFDTTLKPRHSFEFEEPMPTPSLWPASKFGYTAYPSTEQLNNDFGRSETIPITDKPKKKKKFKLNLWSWKSQLLSSLFSFFTIAAMVGVLAKFNEQPLTAWPYTRLSINATIALMSTFIRILSMYPVASAIVQNGWLWFHQEGSRGYGELGHQLRDLDTFDEASRSVFGSVNLLLRSRPQLVWIGAVLSIIAVGFETFSQLVLDIHTRPVLSVNTSSIAAVDNYDSYNKLTVAAAAYAGMYASSIPDLQETCPTSQCSWPRTPSVGICGQCGEMTSYLMKNCTGGNCLYTTPSTKPGTGSYGSGKSLSCSPLNSAGDTFGNYLGGTALRIPTPNTALGPFNGYNISFAPRWNLTTVGALGSGMMFEEDYLMSIANFEIINATITTDRNVSGSPNDTYYYWIAEPVAWQCNLAFCLQAYDTQTKSGQQNQSLAANWTKSIPIDGSSFYQFVDIPAEFNVDGRNYTASTTSSNDIQCGSYGDGLAFTLTDSAELDPLKNDYFSKGPLIPAMGGPGFEDLNSWIDRFAKSMSNYVRANSTLANTTMYTGTSAADVAWITVRWGWLTLPLLMVMLSAMFLVGSILQTAIARAPVWKGNPLASLLCDIDPDIKKQVGTASGTTSNQINKQIGHQRVVLKHDTSGGWIFTSRS